MANATYFYKLWVKTGYRTGEPNVSFELMRMQRLNVKWTYQITKGGNWRNSHHVGFWPRLAVQAWSGGIIIWSVNFMNIGATYRDWDRSELIGAPHWPRLLSAKAPAVPLIHTDTYFKPSLYKYIHTHKFTTNIKVLRYMPSYSGSANIASLDRWLSTIGNVCIWWSTNLKNIGRDG